MGHTTVAVAHVGQYYVQFNRSKGTAEILAKYISVCVYIYGYLYLATQIYFLFSDRHSVNLS